MNASNPSTSACKNFSSMDSSDCGDDFEKSELDSQQSRRVFLLIYSKGNIKKFPPPQWFSSAVPKAFEVSHWVCYQEYHKNKEIHYHMTVNMTKLWRWKSVEEQLKSKHNINVHFFDKSIGYIAAYRYICKSDKNVLHSENHPDLRDIGSPRTKAYMKSNKAVPLGRLVNLSVGFHQKEQKYLVQTSRHYITSLHLQMLQSIFLTA